MPFNADLMRGSIETILLQLLSERQMYGYEIIKEVNVRTEGAFAWKEGTLYPCLHRLEGAGVIAGEWREGDREGKLRKYYRLTRKGEVMAKDRIAEWSAFSNAMGAILFRPV